MPFHTPGSHRLSSDLLFSLKMSAQLRMWCCLHCLEVWVCSESWELDHGAVSGTLIHASRCRAKLLWHNKHNTERYVTAPHLAAASTIRPDSDKCSPPTPPPSLENDAVPPLRAGAWLFLLLFPEEEWKHALLGQLLFASTLICVFCPSVVVMVATPSSTSLDVSTWHHVLLVICLSHGRAGTAPFLLCHTSRDTSRT